MSSGAKHLGVWLILDLVIKTLTVARHLLGVLCHVALVSLFPDSSSSSFRCFFLTPCSIQKLYRKYSIAVIAVQDAVAATVILAVMENLPPCCE